MGSSQKTMQYPYRNFYEKKTSRIFTHEDYPIIENGKQDYISECVCPVCGTRGRKVLVEGDNCPMCYKCWLKCRHYKELSVDTLGLQNQKWISLEETRRIVAHTKNLEVNEETAYKTAQNVTVIYAIIFLVGFLLEEENRELLKKKFSSRRFITKSTVIAYILCIIYCIQDGYFKFNDVWGAALLVLFVRFVIILLLPPKCQ